MLQPTCLEHGTPDPWRVRRVWSERRLFISHGDGVAPLHFVGRDLFNAMSNAPTMAEWVTDAARSLPVKLIFDFPLDRGSGLDCPPDCLIGIVDVQVKGHRSIADRLRPIDAVFRILVGQH